MPRFEGPTTTVMLTKTHYFTAPADLSTCSTADLLQVWQDLIGELSHPFGFFDPTGYQYLDRVRNAMFSRNYLPPAKGGGFLLTPAFPATLRKVAEEIDAEIAHELNHADDSEEDAEALDRWNNPPA